jgi:hypothetical protein
LKKLSWLFVSLILLLGGCSTPPSPTSTTNAPKNISLSFAVQPSNPAPNTPVTLTAKVTGDNKPVNDANVEFEIWNGTSKNHSMLKTKRTGEGTYTITNTYPIAGTYNIVIHATTPQVHQMIAKTFAIADQENAPHEHKAGASGVLLHIQLPSSAKSGQDTKLLGHISQNNKPLTAANVQYEIWKDGDSNHDYTDVAEINPGEYYSTYRFKTAGKYHVKLHVEKGSIHDHTEQTLVVN